MRIATFRRAAIAMAVATTAAIGGAAPAQAQEPGPEPVYCFPNTQKCFYLPCAGRICVTGLGGNIEAIREMIDELLDKVPPPPEQVCTPNLPREPICVST